MNLFLNANLFLLKTVVKNHQIYNDNFALHVIDLSQIHLATDEDIFYQIHHWASLFKARTWEEMKLLASNNEYFAQASESVFQLSTDELIRKQCLDRKEYYQDLRNYERVIAEMSNSLAEKDALISSITLEKDSVINKINTENTKLLARIAELENRK